jgi:hypothetical protein
MIIYGIYYYDEERYPWDWWVYGGGKDMFRFIPHFAENALHYGKPVVFGEFGLTGGIGQEDELSLLDVEGVFLHNGLWAGLMHGLAATPMIWRWYLLPDHPQWWDHFLGLSRFVEGEDFAHTNLRTVTTIENDNMVEHGDFEQGETGWDFHEPSAADFQIVTDEVHGGNNAVRVLADGEGSYVQYERVVGLLADTQYSLGGWIRTETVTGGAWQEGGLCLRMYSTSIPDFTVHEGGSKYGNYIFTDHLGGTNDWTYVGVTFTTPDYTSAVRLNASADGCSGTAWYDDITLLPSGPHAPLTVSDGTLRVKGLTGATTGLFWVQNKEYTWYKVVIEDIMPQVVSDATLTVPNMDSGVYRVEWWDTKSGAVAPVTSAQADESGTLTVAIPPLQTDIACKIKPVPDSDGDGLLEVWETRDFDPDPDVFYNPFDPTDPDSTGDNFEVGPDGVRDGWNDWDGDGVNNAHEFRFGYDPTDPDSWPALPALTTTGISALVLVLVLATRKRTRRMGA